MNQMNQTFHVALDVQEGKKLYLKLNGKVIPLKTHTALSREKAQERNKALAEVSTKEMQKFTYYAEIPAEEMNRKNLGHVMVTEQDDKFRLPVLHHRSIYLPASAAVKYTEEELMNQESYINPKMLQFGLKKDILQSTNGTADAAHIQRLLSDTGCVLTPIDVAKTIVFQHPQIANCNPYYAAIIMNKYIYPDPYIDARQNQRMLDFACEIAAQGPEGWCYREYCCNQNTGVPIEFQYDVLGCKAGDKVEMYTLSDATLEAGKEPLSNALNAINQDSRLMNQSWVVNQGTSCIQTQDTGNSNIKQATFLRTAQKGYTLKAKDIQSYGLSLDSSTLSMKNGKCSIKLTNNFARTLGAYVSFQDDGGNTISNPAGWESNLPECMSKLFENDTLKYLKTIDSIGFIMGVPILANKGELSFPFPEEATKAILKFGSLGGSDYEGMVNIIGGILTGVIQIGIPTFYLTACAAIASTGYFQKYAEDVELITDVVESALEVIKIASLEGTAAEKTKEIVEVIGKTIAGILISNRLEKLLAYIIAEISAEEVENMIPVIGQVFAVANVLLTTTQLVVTATEIACSPATLNAEITRSMDLNVTIRPDHNHGEAGRPETAVWPAVGRTWDITVLYKGGTTQKMTGKLPEVTSSEPIQVIFKALPAGGQLKISSHVYSETGWLCGKWESDWVKALPDNNDVLKEEGEITEILVPLTQDVQYQYKEKLTYSEEDKAYSWKNKEENGESNKPHATKADLQNSGIGNELNDLVNITFNTKEKQVGYVWSASGDNLPPVSENKKVSIEYMVQNISILADKTVNERFKMGEVGFVQRPYIAYDKFGSGLDNFFVDTRNGACVLRRVDLTNGKHGFELDDKEQLCWGRFNQDKLDAMVIHPSGYAIGVNWENSKMEILEIPENGSTVEEAPLALLCSGEGIRQGMLGGPAAMTISYDGRILILETKNQRIQGFDLYGNPVAGFKGKQLFVTDTTDTLENALDNGEMISEIQNVFDVGKVTSLFTMNLSDEAEKALNQGVFIQELADVFADNGVILSVGGTEGTSAITVETITENSWKVTDTIQNALYEMKKEDDICSIYHMMSNVVILSKEKGNKWTIQDNDTAATYLIEKDITGKLIISECLPYMTLYLKEGGSMPTYLDLSVESKGYMYVLYYLNSGEKESDYFMDIYDPDGKFLVTTPDERLQPDNPQFINAAKFEIDDFRNVITLNYEKLTGAGGKTEPSISQWNPTTPVFELDADKETLNAFETKDLEKVKTLFKKNQYPLSDQAYMEILISDAFYQVFDENETETITYDVILSIDKLEVYEVKRKK